MPINLFTDPTHYHSDLRTYLHPLLRPFIGKSSGFTDRQRRELYGLGEEDFRVVTDPRKAQVAVLPMAWNFYRYNAPIERALSFWEKSRKAGLHVFSWNAGDFGVRVPELEGLVVHRCNGYRSKLPAYHRGMPVFISDPLILIYNRSELFLREKNEKPVVGFCGQGDGHLGKYALDIARTTWRNFKCYVRMTYDEPQTLYPSTLLRKRVLDLMESDDRIQTNFIRRKKYRAGVRTEQERQKTTREFYDNMVNSDYIVCVRGGGNFSVRFYEAMAMGRIPLLLDTDCLLPIEEEQSWQEVIVRSNNLDQMGELLLAKFNSTDDEEFVESQERARMFWCDHLTLKGFYLSEISRYC